MSVPSPTTPPYNESEPTITPAIDMEEATLAPISVGRRRRRLPFMVFIGLCLLSVTFVLMFADGGDTTASQAKVVPTPTPTMTPRPSPTATPPDGITLMPGFFAYKDAGQGFIVQYPKAWTYTPANPGIEFDDDSNSPGYIVQVLVPGDATSVGSGARPDDASAWVNYELGNLSKQWQGNFEQVPGPQPGAKIGGTVWQSGVALLGTSASRVRVQVYATVFHGKPYIINVLAADDKFSFGSTTYFGPMLKSFTFLPAAG